MEIVCIGYMSLKSMCLALELAAIAVLGGRYGHENYSLFFLELIKQRFVALLFLYVVLLFFLSSMYSIGSPTVFLKHRVSRDQK
jgi:hypothetical protein